MKTEFYNLIILDESGSMGGVADSTISGCNETLNTIRSSQRKFNDSQTHYVSIFAFQSDSSIPSRYLVKNEPIGEVRDINAELYRPYGMTPLYDALGSTLADLKTVVKDKELAVGNVTIITDGMENASLHYSQEKVVKMISELKKLGWSFNFIGADIDVETTARSLNIDNHMKFSKTTHGIAKMFACEQSSRERWYTRMAEATQCFAAPPETQAEKDALYESRRAVSTGYFEEDEAQDEKDEKK